MDELKNGFSRDNCSSCMEASPARIADHGAIHRKQKLVDVQQMVVDHNIIRTDTHAQMSFTANRIKEGVMGTKQFSKHRIFEAGTSCIVTEQLNIQIRLSNDNERICLSIDEKIFLLW